MLSHDPPGVLGAPLLKRRSSTASSLLAKFSPHRTQHKMIANKQGSTLKSPRPMSTRKSPKDCEPLRVLEDNQAPVITLDDSEDDLVMYASPAQRRKNVRSGIALPPGQNKQPRSCKRSIINLDVDDVDELAPTPAKTARGAVRQEIASTTSAKRKQFFIEKRAYFLPLLPENNHILKLVESHNKLAPNEQADDQKSSPYVELSNQPRGIKATMKPYQLSGMSFLLYLHRNGLSGILGDEMGLGKTLQTLSLIQYLKENEPKGGQARPFLVICPLSVLSSWMTETRKWAPGLRVIRFHGPAKERERVKKIASGEMDFYGNETLSHRKKVQTRRAAAGKSVINVDSESDEDEEHSVDMIVTTYESYQKEHGWFKRAYVWRYVVLDEGHKIKNDKTDISKCLQGLKAEYRLILTGTPVQNNLAELWALLHWLYPEVFVENTKELFADSFNLTKGQVKNKVLDASRSLLELIMLRRMKNSESVNLNLPPKTEVCLFVPLTPMQRFWYTRLITKADQGLLDELFKGAKDKEEAALKEEESSRDLNTETETTALQALQSESLLNSEEWKESRAILEQTLVKEQAEVAGKEDKSSSWRKLMNLLMQLRKVCNHPYQLPHAEPEPYVLGDHLIAASGKFIVLEKLVNELVVRQKKKILIFSGFTRMLDLVEEFLALRGGDGSLFRTARLDGSTARARRNLSMRLFNNMDCDTRVMLISTRAGGLGINLTSATEVVFLDQDWNPQITLQAEARAHRIGQTKPVTIYKLVSQGTVEEQMIGRIQKKLYLSAKVTESMRDIHTLVGKPKKGPGGKVLESAEDDIPQFSTGQLLSLVRRGTSVLSRPEVDVKEMASWDWETTVAKCKDQPTDVSVKNETMIDAVMDEEAEARWLGEMEKVEAHIFEGKKLARANGIKASSSNRDIAREYNRADRRVGKNMTVMVDGYAISKESMDCGAWEAVPTYAGKNPRHAEPKREKKAPVYAQSHCQVCLDGGDLNLCQICPRAYHFNCLSAPFQAKTKAWQFNCPQHECADCGQKTTDAGGMLYRCRWCERAFCEDCTDFEKTALIGETVKEYELLNYAANDNAYYVQCHKCTEHFEESPSDKAIVDQLAVDIGLEYERAFVAADVVAGQAVAVGNTTSFSSRAGSLSDGITIETSGVMTPATIADDLTIMKPTGRSKRKATTTARASTKKMRSNYDPDF